MLYIFVKHLIFKENAICLKEIIKKEGYHCELTDEFIDNDDNFYIIFGSHDIIDKFPKKYIIYQLEQSNVGYVNKENKYIDKNITTFNQKYINQLQGSFEVWDYSKENIKFFDKINTKLDKKIKCKYVPLCYSSYLSQFNNYKHIEKNIDVLFFGFINKRREKIINKLKSKNINIEVYSDLIGEEKIKKILSSKIVLNIHFHENSLLETHRINFLLANKCFVISEHSRDNFEDNNYKNKIIFCNYNNVVNECLQWLKKDEIRQRVAIEGYQSLKTMTISNLIKDTLEIIEYKKNDISKKKKIKYYFPKDIEKPQTFIEDETFVLKLDGIEDDQLPKVSIITPTGNRRKIFSLAIRNFLNIIYPKDKLEWVIVDDGKEELEDILPVDDRIRYIKLNVNKRLPIGKKRNISIEMARYSYIAFMDDDDFYMPENLISRIKVLLKYNKSCVGCSFLGCYNLINRQSLICSDGEQSLCEASMAFKKEFWKERKFNDEDICAEFKYFQHHRQDSMIDIPFQFVMIALNHKNNLTGNTRVLSKFEEWYSENKDKYTDLFEYFDIETQIFLKDLIENLGIKKRSNDFDLLTRG